MIFITPLALELARRCFCGGWGISMPWTAESTLVSGSDMLGVFAGSCWDQVIDGSLQRRETEVSSLLLVRRETGDRRQETRGIDTLFLPLETCVDDELRWLMMADGCCRGTKREVRRRGEQRRSARRGFYCQLRPSDGQIDHRCLLHVPASTVSSGRAG